MNYLKGIIASSFFSGRREAASMPMESAPDSLHAPVPHSDAGAEQTIFSAHREVAQPLNSIDSPDTGSITGIVRSETAVESSPMPIVATAAVEPSPASTEELSPVSSERRDGVVVTSSFAIDNRVASDDSGIAARVDVTEAVKSDTASSSESSERQPPPANKFSGEVEGVKAFARVESPFAEKHPPRSGMKYGNMSASSTTSESRSESAGLIIEQSSMHPLVVDPDKRERIDVEQEYRGVLYSSSGLPLSSVHHSDITKSVQSVNELPLDDLSLKAEAINASVSVSGREKFKEEELRQHRVLKDSVGDLPASPEIQKREAAAKSTGGKTMAPQNVAVPQSVAGREQGVASSLPKAKEGYDFRSANGNRESSTQQRSGDVHIGQIDVVIEAPKAVRQSQPAQQSPFIDSRYYIRGL